MSNEIPASFIALMQESERVGWPTSYVKDLYYHDRNYLADYNPPQFGWMLRDMGTHLFDPREVTALEWARASIKVFGTDNRFYWYDGATLTEVSPSELLRRLGDRDNG